MGEVQVWDVAKRKLALSVPVTYDTVYGASWSPDGTKIAFGCADNTVRAIDAKTGEQVLFMGSHSDWVLDTVFSADGTHLISVGRDMTAKLTEVATQRFIDNITSITPGALKGGLTAVARHPKRDEIVVGGSDGEPKLYRMFRQTARVIGDDSNLIREFPPHAGPGVQRRDQRDGKRIAAGSSLDGTGEVDVYAYEFDTTLPGQHQGDQRRRSSRRDRQRRAQTLEKYHKEGVKQIAKRQAAAGGRLRGGVPPRRQGRWPPPAPTAIVRLINPETGSPSRSSPRRRSRPASSRTRTPPISAVPPKHGGEPSRPRCCPRVQARRPWRSSPRRSG